MPTCNGAEKAEGGRVVCGGVLVDHALAGGHRNRYGQSYRFVELSPEKKYFFCNVCSEKGWERTLDYKLHWYPKHVSLFVT